MREKVIQIPFSYNLLVAKQKVLWIYSFKKVASRYYIYSSISIVTLIIGWFTDRTGGIPFFTLLGVGLFIYVIVKWYNVYQNRKAYFRELKTYPYKHEKESLDLTFIFSDDVLQYQDKNRLFKLNWVIFNPVEIFKDIIILTVKETETIFTFSKQELGNENYQEIEAILKEKTTGQNNIDG